MTAIIDIIIEVVQTILLLEIIGTLNRIRTASKAVRAVPHIHYQKGDDLMARTKKEKPSMWERSNYEILSETVTETETVAVLRNTYNGAIIECHVPKHTPEEEQRIANNAARAMMQIVYSGQDISHIKKMSILMD